MRDGWHVIHGYDVFVRDGKILRGISSKNDTIYPYRWDKELRCWNAYYYGISVPQFRRGINSGNISMW